MTHWIIRHREAGEEQYVQCLEGPPPYDPEVFDLAELPREIDAQIEKWDWDAGEIVTRFTPAEAVEIMWERAKLYRDVDRYFATLPVDNVVPGAVIMVECDDRDPRRDRKKVTDLAQAATWAMLQEADPEFEGEHFSVTFTDGANQPFTVNAEQTIAIKAAVTRNDALCHAASQLVRATLTAALHGGATADEIFAIDITAGYPALEP